jgi:hypothetical protein
MNLFVACEFSGVATSGALDQAATSSGIGTAASSGTTGTTAQANELVFALTGGTWSTTCSSPTNGFTTIGSDGCLLAYKVVSSTGTESSQSTVSMYGPWGGAIATFE